MRVDCGKCIHFGCSYSNYPCDECIHNELIFDHFEEKEEKEEKEEEEDNT